MTTDWRASMAACGQMVTRREVSVEEIARQTLAEIERVDGWLKAFTYLEPDRVLAEARGLDARLGRGEALGALAGVPVAVKDLYDVVGLPTSYGGPPHESFLPERDATCVARLRAAGALTVGKTRTAEFAWRTVTPPTVNPRDPRLVAGGSSGGSAAAVGAGLVPLGLGTDTGGSIRIPAALCGTVGIKPTYGVVGRSGILPANLSLDTAGPLTRSVADARLALAHLAGHDPGDPGSAPERSVEPLRARLLRPGAPAELRGARLGIVDEPLFEIVEPRTRAQHERLLARLEDAGAELVRVRLPEANYVMATLLAIDLPEGAALHTERLRAHAAEFVEDVRLLLHFAHAIPAVLAARGHQVRRDIQGSVETLFREQRLRALVAPASAGPAIPSDDLGVTFERADGSRESAIWSYARVCWLANLTGQPALVVPTELEPPPLGVQLIGRPFRDDDLLDLGAAIEALLPL